MVDIDENRTHHTCACRVASTLPSSSARKPRNPSAWGAVPSRLGRRWREDIRAIRVTLCSPVARTQPVGKPCVSPCSLVPARHEPTLTRGRIEAEAADPPGSTPAGNWCHRSRPSPLRECCRFLTFFPFSPPSLYFKKFEDFTHHGHLALYQILGSNTPWTQGPAYNYLTHPGHKARHKYLLHI